jgi:hypothetical protein
MKSHNEPGPTSLNGLQKSIIEGTLNTYLEDIAKLKPNDAIEALKTVTENYISSEEKKTFENQKILDDIEFIRRILLHPCPENRNISYPYVGQEEGYSISNSR